MKRISWTFALAGLAFVPNAKAGPTMRLTYERGAGAEICPNETELRRAVSERLGRDPFVTRGAISVVAKIDATALGQFRGSVTIIDDAGEVLGVRELTTADADCVELLGALALDVSIVVDVADDLTRALPAPSVPRGASAPPSGVGEVLAPSLLESVPAPNVSRSKALVEAALGGALALGAAPSASLGARALVAVRWRAVRLGAEGRADLPSSGGAPHGGDARSSLLAGSLLACVQVGLPFVCGMGTAGSIHGAGVNITNPRSGDAPYVSVGLRVGVDFPLGSRFALRSQLDGAYVLTRPTIQIDGLDAFSVVWINGTASLAGVVYF